MGKQKKNSKKIVVRICPRCGNDIPMRFRCEYIVCNHCGCHIQRDDEAIKEYRQYGKN